MIANKFIDFFNENSSSTKFYFKNFKKAILDQLTPKKLQISYDKDEKSQAYELRNCIVSNLGLNPCFYENDGHDTASLKSLITILVDTKNGDLNENQIAQLTLLVHLSKSICKKVEQWDDFFVDIHFLRIDNESEFKFKSQLIELFQQLKLSNIIYSRILTAVKIVTGNNEANFEINELKLNFFTSSFPGLNGFSGINSIYISQNRIIDFINSLSTIYNDQHTILEIVKLNFARMFVNEATHVFIRRVVKDFNASSPKIEKENSDLNLILESGILGEKQVFTERKSWIKSIHSLEFNLKYCVNFLKNILDGKNVNFDLEMSGCKINTNQITLMGIDCNEEENIEIL